MFKIFVKSIEMMFQNKQWQNVWRISPDSVTFLSSIRTLNVLLFDHIFPRQIRACPLSLGSNFFPKFFSIFLTAYFSFIDTCALALISLCTNSIFGNQIDNSNLFELLSCHFRNLFNFFVQKLRIKFPFDPRVAFTSGVLISNC